MTWLIWRQHRLQTAVVAVALVALGLLLLPTGLRMHEAFGDIGQCLAANGEPDSECIGLMNAFTERFRGLEVISLAFLFAPLLVGMFLGAPLVAGELEHGTQRLVWTQGVTRLRWALAKIVFVMAAAAAIGACLALLFSWWLDPLTEVSGSPVEPGWFDMQGIVLVAYTVFAVALGVAASTYVRSLLPALALTAGAFLAARLAVFFWARERLVSPVRQAEPVLGGRELSSEDGWILSTSVYDANGNLLSPGQSVCMRGDSTCADKFGSGPLEGAFSVVEYHPNDRFWTLQAIESGIYMAAALPLLAVALYRIRRRLS
jgi:hypothetical protein